MGFIFKKEDDTLQKFDVEKFRRSITRPGTPPHLVEQLIAHVQENVSKLKSSEDIFRFAFEWLKEKEPHIAVRYNLKRAILEFGPTGFPFEQFVAELFKAQGYQVMTNQIIKGWCVDHEVDLIAQKGSESFMIECKFHNNLHYKSHVQVPLYTEARFHDIEKTWQPDSPQHTLTHSWIITNTSFTYEAIKYSNCVGITLTSWDYPQTDNLAQLIIKFSLYPITAITSLSKSQKRRLVAKGITLAKDVEKNPHLLKKAGLKPSEIKHLIQECTFICST